MEYENSLLDKVGRYIREKQLLNKKNPVLIGFSGGADSMALLDILHSLNYSCIAAHCDFHLRGSESIRDHEFARCKAAEYGIPFYSVDFQAKDYASQHGVSIEMACRELRYQWFEELLHTTGAQAIAIAHHRDDSIETFFLNLLRGTGIAGLTGINAANGSIVRPLSCISRQDIEAYLAARSIDHITDSTNKEDIYQRNKIRLQVIPLLKEINPNACDSIERTILNLQQAELIYNQAICEAKSHIVSNQNGDVHISISKLKKTVAPKTVLFEILRPFNVSPSVCQDVFNMVDAISGKYIIAGNYRILKDRSSIIISNLTSRNFIHTQIPADCESINVPVEMHFERLNYFPGFVIPKERDVACFDEDKIEYPLVLRKWEQGDKFVPFGMRGIKKVSDYFSDHKFSLADKERTWLLCSGDKILWIIGQRTDDRFKISSSTKKVLMIKL